jgi:hypothetical protein
MYIKHSALNLPLGPRGKNHIIKNNIFQIFVIDYKLIQRKHRGQTKSLMYQ